MTPTVASQTGDRMRLGAAVASLLIGVALMGVKYFAYQLTGSTAVLSDALESVVNVVAAIFAVGGLRFAHRPADRNHPYGHGKIEFFSAVFEGGLIAFAALLIIYQAVVGFYFGTHMRSLDVGVLITLAAGLVNAALGWFLVRTGKRYQSLTLIADGRHVLSDFWTSAGVALGLALVMLTGHEFLDPLVAAIVGVNLAWTGARLVRHAAGGLLDEEDTELVRKVVNALNANLHPGIIQVHHLRAIRSGRFTHLDAHLVVPEFWTVEQAHATADDFEQRVLDSLEFDGEIAFHTDPCHRLYCAMCDVPNCPIRVEPFVGRTPLTYAQAVKPDVRLKPEAA